MNDFQKAIDAMLDALSEQFDREAAALPRVRGNMVEGDAVNEILRRQSEELADRLDEWVARVRRRDAALGDALEAELAPIREAMRTLTWRNLVRLH